MCWSQHVRIRGVVFRVTCWKHVRITFCGNILGLLCSMCNMLGLLEVHVCKLKMCVYTIHCFGSVKAKEDLLQSPGNTRLDFLFLRCRYHFNTKKGKRKILGSCFSYMISKETSISLNDFNFEEVSHEY